MIYKAEKTTSATQLQTGQTDAGADTSGCEQQQEQGKNKGQRADVVSILTWNKLSTYCITASNVNMFKNKVETYIGRADYT